MRIGIPAESDTYQPLVAATPDTVAKLISLGYEVMVQRAAGAQSSFPDAAYEKAGAALVGEEVWQADIVITLDRPSAEYLDQIPKNSTLISRMQPGRDSKTVEDLAQRGITGLALDVVPRISRAQSMDVLSSIANIAGYRAVIEAAAHFGRLFTGQVTAAGKMPPAHVYIIGAGVAGLAAIGTAQSMGAVVKATDLRPETAEQVESMGAQFVPIPAATEESEDGYAKEMTADQAQAAAKLYSEQAALADIVITTANIPGKRSPLLLTAADVAEMRPGSVVVDMAAAGGGNCELTKPGEVYTTEGGVTIIGYSDLAGRLPGQASQLYGQNVVNLLKLMTPNKDGVLTLDLDDEIVRGITVAHEGEVLWPPPPVKVSAHKTEPANAEEQPTDQESVEKPSRGRLWLALGALLALALVILSPAQVIAYYMVLMLAIVVGFYVITSVTHSLHTPLMSETNAISGIILVGAVLQVGSENLAVTVMSVIAIVIASINIFGGFTVTHRMLSMFRKEA